MLSLFKHMAKKMRFNPQESPATEKVAGNEDLIVEILLRLPAKALVRSKLVSKQWLSLTSDPKFIETHVRQNYSSRTALVFYDFRGQSEEYRYVPLGGPQYNEGETVPSLAFLDNLFGGSSKSKTVQSCNGLLLCLFIPDNALVMEKYIVCNPTTKKYTELPLPIDYETLYYYCFTLAFDPSISPHYKVICLKLTTLKEELCEIEIYSSEDHSWRSSFSRVPFSIDGVFMNGSVFWDEYCFNVVTEEVMRLADCVPSNRIIPMEEYCKTWHSKEIGDSDKRIFLLEISNVSSKWVIKHRVAVGSFQLNIPRPSEEEGSLSFIPKCLVTGFQGEDSELVLEIPGNILSYNLTDDTVKALFDLPDGMKYGNSCVYLFVESLAFV